MRYIFSVVFIVFLVGCSSKQPKVLEHNTSQIRDLVEIPQDISYFTQHIKPHEQFYDVQKKYEKYYFSVWNNTRPREKLQDVKWPFRSYRADNTYGENLQPLEQEFFDEMLENANFDEYGTLNKYAITLKELSIRAFPTIRPVLRDPSLAGEGFPFDYMQNTTIHANKPIFVSHYSKDKAWVYIFSSFASGWVKSGDIVYLDKQYTDEWQKAQQVRFTQEDIPLYSQEAQEYVFHSKIGMMLPLVDEDEDSYTLLSIQKLRFHEPLFVQIKVSKSIASKDVLKFTPSNMQMIVTELLESNYGWGGIYEQRDCSSTMRDLFAPFGVWLPRNSSQQAKVGEVINLEKLSAKNKAKIIKEVAVPFETLLYKRGHIVLYIGTYNDEIIIFQNVWGIKTKKEGEYGRIIIGRSIISTLKLGEEQPFYDPNSEMLKNLKSMNIVTK